MTYEQAVNYIDEIPKFTKKNTLENTKKLLEIMRVFLRPRLQYTMNMESRFV